MPDKPTLPLAQQPPVKADPESQDEMETHAHHLHKAPGKGVWHYVFEFLMLFLAVTLGFFVENQREKYVEHQREKEYARSLYDDLVVDTFVIQRTIGEKVWIAAKYDSAMKILDEGTIRKHNEFLYYTAKYLTLNDAFTPQDITYRQLLSSGNFRYIENTGLYKKIAEYYNLCSRYQLLDNFGAAMDEKLLELVPRLFNVKEFYSFSGVGNFTFYDLKRPEGKFELIKKDPAGLRQLYLKYGNARDIAIGTSIFLGWLKDRSTNIIKELETEYSLAPSAPDSN